MRKAIFVSLFAVACMSVSIATAQSAKPLGEMTRPFTPKKHWLSNRLADFRDMFYFGVGVTAENEKTGWLPPALGLHVDMPFISVGGLEFHGAAVEMEGRAFGAYTFERRKLRGYGPYRRWDIQQVPGKVSFYKDPELSERWTERMSDELAYTGKSDLYDFLEWLAIILPFKHEYRRQEKIPAKVLIHPVKEENSYMWDNDGMISTVRGQRSGWHRWTYFGGEIALFEPVITHMGATVRGGFDVSEFFDFALGFVGIDFLRDDLQDDDVKVQNR